MIPIIYPLSCHQEDHPSGRINLLFRKNTKILPPKYDTKDYYNSTKLSAKNKNKIQAYCMHYSKPFHLKSLDSRDILLNPAN
jgi:hypothetical protein